MSESATRIALLYPELLGTYGDGGNARVLLRRLAWRGLPAEAVEVAAGSAVPSSCDVYLLGGGEDEPQVLATEGLRRERGLAAAVEGGAVVLAVCAGYQVLGHSFPGADGVEHAGLGLLDVTTRRSLSPPGEPAPPRAVGDLVVEPDPVVLPGLPLLFGYENHSGRTVPGPGGRGRPLGRVLVGTGNGTPDRTDGLVDGRVVATYLHGPVLAQNPALADLLLRWVHPDLPELAEPPETRRLRAARARALGVSELSAA